MRWLPWTSKGGRSRAGSAGRQGSSAWARLGRLAGLGLSASLVFACGEPPPVPPKHPTHPPAAPPAPPPPPEVVPMLPSHVVALLDDESSSPYFARRGEEGLLFFGSQGRWLTRPIAADGSPKTKAALDVANAGEVTMASLKAAGDGYLAIWVETVSKSHSVKLLALDAEGRPRGEPSLVAQVADEIAWADVLPNAQGALVIWEVPHEDRSDVIVTPVINGKVDGAPAPAAQNVYGWQIVGTERGAALATVMIDAPDPSAVAPAKAPKGSKKKEPITLSEPRGERLGRVLLTELDPRGKPGPAVTVSAEPSAQFDVEIVEAGGKYVVAWTDLRNLDACVYTASIDPGGKIAAAAHRATPPLGDQALVSLVASSWSPAGPKSSRALLAWEDLLRAPREGRLIHLATLGPDGTLAKERATLTFAASGPPDLVPDGDGFAAVTLAPVPEAIDDDEAPPPAGSPGPVARARKKEAPIWPQYVRFGADLGVLASEPVRADPFADHDGVPYVTRTLTCAGGNCTTLASGAGKGAPLALVSLPIKKSAFAPSARRDPDETPPRPTAVGALFDGDHLARVAAADLPGGGSMAAWVTYYLDGSINVVGGKKKDKKDDEGPFATLGVRPVAADGTPGKPVILSKKALSIGGVALAPASDGKKVETVVAWVAREKGEPQVFVTKVGPNGEKVAQKGVTVIARAPKGKGNTKGPSEASDVAIAADGKGGFIVAWVDTRDGNAEIYVARIDKSLTKVVPDKRITDAPGDSAEVQIAMFEGEPYLVWSDARNNPDDGTGDIYLARLDGRTLEKKEPETRLFASALHSRTPQIVVQNGGFWVAWVEDAFGVGREPKSDPAAVQAESGLRIARVDPKRHALVGSPQLVHGEGGASVTAATITCDANCRGVLTSTVNGALVLGAFQWNRGADVDKLKTLATLTGPLTEDVSPVFSGADGKSLFFADDSVSGAGRVRWMSLAWP